MFYLKFAKRRRFLRALRFVCENFAKNSAKIANFTFFFAFSQKIAYCGDRESTIIKHTSTATFWEGGRTLFRRFSRNFRDFRAFDAAIRNV